MHGISAGVWIAVAIAVLIGLAVAFVALGRSGRREGAPLPPELAGACSLLGLERATGRWTPPSCVGEMGGVRVAVVTGVRDRPTTHVAGTSVEVLVDTGLHTGMPTTGVPGTGLAAKLPKDVALLGGASLFKGSGADLAIRSRWPEGWAELYLMGAPARGEVTPESIRDAALHLIELRRALRGEGA